MDVLAEANQNLMKEAPLSSGKPAKMPRIERAEEKLQVKKLSDKATLPKRGSAGAAGYDLARCEGALFTRRLRKLSS
jgi:dUTP pyrophosphatase